MDMKKGTTIGIGLVLGSLVGVSAALLAAPKSGSETRAAIREKSGQVVSAASKELANGREKAQELIATARTRASELSEKVRRQPMPALEASSEVLAE